MDEKTYLLATLNERLAFMQQMIGMVQKGESLSENLIQDFMGVLATMYLLIEKNYMRSVSLIETYNEVEKLRNSILIDMEDYFTNDENQPA